MGRRHKVASSKCLHGVSNHLMLEEFSTPELLVQWGFTHDDNSITLAFIDAFNCQSTSRILLSCEWLFPGGAKMCSQPRGSRKRPWNGTSTSPVLAPSTLLQAPCPTHLPPLFLLSYLCTSRGVTAGRCNPPFPSPIFSLPC